jgi:hypothetical protein
VTSDPAQSAEPADDDQGESGRRRCGRKRCKYLVINILTPKSLGLKILADDFCESGALLGFPGGTRPHPWFFPKCALRESSFPHFTYDNYFREISTSVGLAAEGLAPHAGSHPAS